MFHQHTLERLFIKGGVEWEYSSSELVLTTEDAEWLGKMSDTWHSKRLSWIEITCYVGKNMGQRHANIVSRIPFYESASIVPNT